VPNIQNKSHAKRTFVARTSFDEFLKPRLLARADEMIE
jgi:hypothetical protein